MRPVRRVHPRATATVLPRARKTNQLPAELYADNLKRFGVQMDPQGGDEARAPRVISRRAARSSLARRIAEEHRWSKTAIADVIRELEEAAYSRRSNAPPAAISAGS